MNDIDKLQDKIDTIYTVLKSLSDTREDFGKRLNELENNNMAAGDHSHQIKALHDQLQRLLLRDNKVGELQGSCKLFFDRVINLEHIGATNDNLSKAALRRTKKIQDKINAMKQKTKNTIDDIVSRQKKVNEIVFERLGYLDNEICKVEPQHPLLKKVGDTIKDDNGDEHTIVKIVTEEEIRPQVGEVWEANNGEHYKIDKIDLQETTNYQLQGHNIMSNIEECWCLSGNYVSDGVPTEVDLIKKISDAPKPESKLPQQPGEIWKNGDGEFILLFSSDDDTWVGIRSDGDVNYYTKLEGLYLPLEVDEPVFDLKEKTDLTFADFLKLNKGG